MKISTVAFLFAATIASLAPTIAQAGTVRHHMHHRMMMHHHMHMMTGGRMPASRNF